jgi:serine/threonine protein phosphatase PrpC
MAALTSNDGVVLDAAQLSDAGRDPEKQINEDSAAVTVAALGHLGVVCDGMGGHAGGQKASQLAVSTIREIVEQAPASARAADALRGAVQQAGAAVFAFGGAAPPELRPGSTCVAVLVTARDAHVAHVGDSRAFLCREGQLQRLTRDHSLVEEMVDAGVLSRAEAAHHPDANKITRALGIRAEVAVELSSLLIGAGDTFVLASDGLTDLIKDGEIAAHCDSGKAPEVICQELVALANQRGGHDNITVQVLRVVELPNRDKLPSPTLTDVRGEQGPARTLVDVAYAPAATPDSSPEASAPGTRPTTLTEEPPHGAEARHTVVDARGGERLTEPGLSSLGAAGPGPNGAQARSARPSSIVVAVSAALAILVLGAVVVWWLIGALRSRDPEDAPPPPEPHGTLLVPRATRVGYALNLDDTRFRQTDPRHR